MAMMIRRSVVPSTGVGTISLAKLNEFAEAEFPDVDQDKLVIWIRLMSLSDPEGPQEIWMGVPEEE